MRTPFDQIDICIAGMTDLCAPEFDDRFDARLPVREAAKHLVSAGSKQAICIFYLDHLLRGHEMRAVEDHALDGACLLNKCSYENTSMPCTMSLWRAYIRPLGSAHCPTPATQKQRSPRDTRGTPEGRQGVHPTPWQCTLSHACHAKAAEPKGHQRDARGTPGRTSDPLAVHIVSRLPRKSSGAQGTPEGRQRDARAYIRPLGSAHCPTPATQKQRSPRDSRGTPEGRQGVHPTPWQCTLSHACHAKAAEPNEHQRDARGTPEGRQRDARGTPGRTSHPLAVHIVPRLPRKSSGAQGTPEGRQRDARAYIRPLGSAHCPTPATQKQRSPRDTRGTPDNVMDYKL